MKIKIDWYGCEWRWWVVGKSGTEMARSVSPYRSAKSAFRAVRRLFGKDVKVEVVR